MGCPKRHRACAEGATVGARWSLEGLGLPIGQHLISVAMSHTLPHNRGAVILAKAEFSEIFGKQQYLRSHLAHFRSRPIMLRNPNGQRSKACFRPQAAVSLANSSLAEASACTNGDVAANKVRAFCWNGHPRALGADVKRWGTRRLRKFSAGGSGGRIASSSSWTMNEMAALPNPSASRANPAKAPSGTPATVPSEPPDKKTAAGAGRAVPAPVHQSHDKCGDAGVCSR